MESCSSRIFVRVASVADSSHRAQTLLIADVDDRRGDRTRCAQISLTLIGLVERGPPRGTDQLHVDALEQQAQLRFGDLHATNVFWDCERDPISAAVEPREQDAVAPTVVPKKFEVGSSFVV